MEAKEQRRQMSPEEEGEEEEALRVTTLQRSNFPLKRKKEREGESLALLRI